MTPDKHDPPQPSARKRLRDAIYDLVLERGYDGFTVGDLLQRAGVARSSFYAHFRDKDDLLLHGFEEIGHPMPPSGEGDTHTPKGLPDFAHWIFTATEDSKPLTRSLLAGSSRTLVSQHLENTLVVLVREALRPLHPADSPVFMQEMAVRYHVGALMALWLWWVHHDFPCPACEMVASFNQLTQDGLFRARG